MSRCLQPNVLMKVALPCVMSLIQTYLSMSGSFEPATGALQHPPLALLSLIFLAF